jgi:alkane 1-monooxygenase
MSFLEAAGTVPEGSTDAWRDKKRYLWLMGLAVPGLGILALFAFAHTHWSWLLWIGPLLVLVIVPLVDLAVGLDPSNPPDELIEQLANDKYYRWITYLYIPIQYVVFFGAMAAAVGRNPLADTANAVGLGGWAREHLPTIVAPLGLTTLDKVALSISVGVVGGIAINTAHELGHKREDVERWLSKIALAQSFYGHFYVEHNRGHHVRVATKEDPASSRMGESFYRFWPRTVVGSLKSAWRVESKRFTRRGQSPVRLSNDVLNAWLMSVVLWGAILALFGWGVLPYLLLQAVVAFSLLEVVNYLEHYGMLRQRVGVPGKERYERVTPFHSWNSNNIATNVLLYHLQRHSDHHANPTRRYQCLRDFKEAPALPTGYAGMICLAIIPPLWRRVMDPRVAAHFDGDIRLANLEPGKEAQLLKRFPPPAVELEVEREDTGQSLGDEVLATQCPGCGYRYEVAAGDEHQGFAAGTSWADIPEDWFCPDCGVRDKKDFIAVEPVGS